MASTQNFDNGSRQFNIHLEPNGALTFNANDVDGLGDTRMVIDDSSGQVTIGGSGEAGRLQLKTSTGANMVFLGGSGTEASALLGGGPAGVSGRLELSDAAGQRTFELNGQLGRFDLGGVGNDGDLFVQDDTGTTTIHLDGGSGELTLDAPGGGHRIDLQGGTARIELTDGSGDETVVLRGDDASLELGANGQAGRLEVLDAARATAISCDGSTGTIECETLVQRADGGPRASSTPLQGALGTVLRLQAVRYERTRSPAPTPGAGDGRRIGFVGREVATVSADLVTADADGQPSVDYLRLTAVLVEAVKEQHQLIREQAAALSALSDRLERPSIPAQGTRS